jgi:ubiquinone/menaquinone biosynthesis C-methylase UbiE
VTRPSSSYSGLTHHPESRGFRRAGSREDSAWVRALSELLPDPPADVLDVGTGTEFVARTAASLGHRVVGIDLSAKMVDVARSRGCADGVAVEFALGDAVGPDFPPWSFDALTNRSLIWTLLELDAALAAWHALLRPGGRLVCFYGLVDRGASPLRPKQESLGAREEKPLAPHLRADRERLRYRNVNRLFVCRGVRVRGGRVYGWARQLWLHSRRRTHT